jgi:hypothetical protein
VSFRWSDWDSREILNRLDKIFHQAAAAVKSELTTNKQDDVWRFSLQGALSGDFLVNIDRDDIIRRERGNDIRLNVFSRR